MTLATALFSSDRDDWNSPECAIAPALQLGPIELDPCSNAQSIVGACVEWRLDRGEDGLRDDWFSNGRHGVCWVNPPYGRDIVKWAGRMFSFGRAGVQIVGLLPARTDTLWFQSFIARADALCFWRGRLEFGPAIADRAQASLWASAPAELAPADPAPFPSVLPYFGDNRNAFRRAYESHGLVVFP